MALVLLDPKRRRHTLVIVPPPPGERCCLALNFHDRRYSSKGDSPHDALVRLLPKLSPSVNLEFNPYFLDLALQNHFKIVECPITFHPRIGKSKGGNQNNFVALR